jgi:hypothetical protein
MNLQKHDKARAVTRCYGTQMHSPEATNENI